MNGPNGGEGEGVLDDVPGRLQMILELRKGGVSDQRLLNVMETLPRELFLPDLFKPRAYENVALPIGHHQTISQPLVVARMTQALEVSDRTKVLEIGTGSGYQTAVLAKLCRRVYTLERHKPLLREAEARLAQLRLTNVVARHGDGTAGWREQAPFERILCTAACADIPALLFRQLAPGGIMVVPVGVDETDQHLMLVRKTDDGAETEELAPVRFVPMIGDDEDHPR